MNTLFKILLIRKQQMEESENFFHTTTRNSPYKVAFPKNSKVVLYPLEL